MIRVRAYAKLNLFLKIYDLRPDKFHNLVSIMQSVDLTDVLDFELTDGEGITLTCSNDQVPVDETNLVWRAAAALAARADRDVGGLKIHIEKNIPVKGGLAGGSADCAAALIALRDLWKLELEDGALLSIGAELGSDVPFCIIGGTMLVSNRGERLEPMAEGISASAKCAGGFMLVVPPTDIETPVAYGLLDIDRSKQELDWKDIAEDYSLIRDSWMNAISTGEFAMLFCNDFETPVYNVWQELADIYNNVRNHAGHALLSGSGSCMFAWLPSVEEAMRATETYNPVAGEVAIAVFPAKSGVEILE